MITAAHSLDSPQSFPLDDLLHIAAELVDRGTLDSLALAEALLNEARPEVEKRVAAVIAQFHASPYEKIETHPFCEYFSTLARLAEKQGDPERALNALRSAREYVSTNGNPHTHAFRDDIDRLRRAQLGIAPPAGRPVDFDPDWLASPARTDTEAESAIASWSNLRWQIFPRNAAEATGTPLAMALIHCFEVARVWPEGQQLWRLVALHDRFGAIGIAYPTRQLRIWERAFEPEGAIRIAFGIDEPPARERWEAYQEWLTQIEVGSVDEKAVLEALPPEAYERIAVRLRRLGPALDLERLIVTRSRVQSGPPAS